TTTITAVATTTTATTTTAAFKRTSATTTAAAVTTTTAAAALFTRTCDVDRQWATFNGFAVELLNGRESFAVGAHRDECESTALAGEFIHIQQHIANGSCLTEDVLQVDFRYVEVKIPNLKFVI